MKSVIKKIMKKVTKKPTQPISWKRYCSNPALPKLMTTHDIIQYIVNKEDEAMHPVGIRELIQIRNKKTKLSPATAYVFAKGIFSSLRP
jgi:hypothetical protein